MSGPTSYQSGSTLHTTLSVTHHRRPSEQDGLLQARKRGNAVVACLIMIVGLGSVMPFNALVNVVDYFYDTYDDSPVEYYMAVAFGLAQPLLAHIMYKFHIGARSTANHVRIIGVFALQGVQFLVLPGYTATLPAQEAYWITLVIALALGVQACALQPSLVAFGSALPRGYCQLLMAAQGCSAVITCAFRLMTKAVAAPGGDMGAMAFLLVIGGAQATCAIMYACLLRSSFVKYHLGRVLLGSPDDTDDDMRFTRFSDVSEDDATEASMPKSDAVSRQSMCAVAPEAFALFMSMVTTFALFPGEITSLWYHGGSWGALDMLQDRGWWPLTLVAVICVFNLVGRSVSPLLTRWIGRSTIVVLSLLRIGVVPAVVMYRNGEAHDVLTDTAMLFLLSAYALSNGVVVATSMSLATKAVDYEDRASVAHFMGQVFRFGMSIGTFLALLVRVVGDGNSSVLESYT